jgi:hypothetical protein
MQEGKLIGNACPSGHGSDLSFFTFSSGCWPSNSGPLGPVSNLPKSLLLQV